LSWQLKTPTRTWKCTRCIMHMSCLYASGFPFKNFYKLAQYAETIQCLCYEANGKRHSVYYWVMVYLGGLLSTQGARFASCDSYASFLLSNLPRKISFVGIGQNWSRGTISRGHYLSIGSLRYRRLRGDGDVESDYDWGEIACACSPAVALTSATWDQWVCRRSENELILFVFLIYCQFCHLYSRDSIIKFRTDHSTVSRPAQKTFCFFHVKMTEATCKLASVKSKLSK